MSDEKNITTVNPEAEKLRAANLAESEHVQALMKTIAKRKRARETNSNSRFSNQSS